MRIGLLLWAVALGSDANPAKTSGQGTDARDLTRVKDTARLVSEERRTSAATAELVKLHAERDQLKAREVAVLKERESANKAAITDAHLVIERLEGQVNAQERELAKARAEIIGLESDVERMGKGLLDLVGEGASADSIKGLEDDLQREGTALLKAEAEREASPKREEPAKPAAASTPASTTARGALGHEVHGLAAKASALAKNVKGADSKLIHSLVSGLRTLEKHVAAEEKTSSEAAMNLKAVTHQRDVLADTVQRISHGEDEQPQEASADATQEQQEQQDADSQDTVAPEVVEATVAPAPPKPHAHVHKKHFMSRHPHAAEIAQESMNADMRARAHRRVHHSRRVLLAAEEPEEEPEVAADTEDSEDAPVALADKSIEKSDKVEEKAEVKTEKKETKKVEKVEKVEEKVEEKVDAESEDADSTEDSTETDESAEAPEDPAPAAKESTNKTVSSAELLPPPPLPPSDETSLVPPEGIPRKSLRAIRPEQLHADDDVDEDDDVVADVAASDDA